jgi:hypothetical protein
MRSQTLGLQLLYCRPGMLGSHDRPQRTQLKAPPKTYCAYYHRTRTHLALDKDCPEPREVQAPETGLIVSIPELGGLHHRYERRAA